MKTSSICIFCLVLATLGTADYFGTPLDGQDVFAEAETSKPPESKKVMLKVPVGDGKTFLSVAALIHTDITEITVTPIIENNKVSGARIQSLDQDHTIRASGTSLVLDLPTGQVTVGGTFAITSKEGRTMFAVKLVPDKPAVSSTTPPDTTKTTGGEKVVTVPPPTLPGADERIKQILKPKTPEAKDDE